MHTRSFTRWSALFLCAALLFSRVALAAFVCPMEQPAAAAMQMDGCDGDDPGLAHLCEKCCQDEPQKFEPALAFAIPSSFDGGIRVALVPLALPAVHRAGFVVPHANAPPLTILFGRIRQ